MKLHLSKLCRVLLLFTSLVATISWADESSKNGKNAAITRLQAQLKSPEIEMRRQAALELNDLGDKSGVPVMIKDLATPDLQLRRNIVVALRILKDKRAIPVLRGALKDKSPYIRGIALAALGEVKAMEVFDEIVAHLRDREDEENVCMPSAPAHSAIYALGTLGEKKAIPVLMKLLDDKGLKNEYYAPIAQALGALTGEKFGYDIDKWRTWWKAQRRVL